MANLPVDPFGQFPAPATPSVPYAKGMGASWVDKNGNPQQGAAAPPGQVFRDSALLQPDASGRLTSTSQGDAFNQFRGYDNGLGGTFGGNVADTGLGTWDPSQANVAVNPNGSVSLQNHDPAQVAAFNASPQAAALARMNGDQSLEAYKAANGGVDPFAGLANGGAAIQSPDLSSARDPLGRTDAPTDASHVITPALEAQLAAKAMEVQQPQVDGAISPSGAPMTAPNTLQQPANPLGSAANPFAQFAAPGASTIPSPTFPTLSMPPGPTDQGPTTVPGASIGGGFTPGGGAGPGGATGSTVPGGTDIGDGGTLNTPAPIFGQTDGWGNPNPAGGPSAPTAPADGGGLAPGMRPIGRRNTTRFQELAPQATGMFPGGMRPVKPTGGAGGGNAAAPMPSTLY